LFVTENETEAAITEALQTFQTWNPKVSPRYGMTDYCIEEIKGMEKVFEGNLFNHCYKPAIKVLKCW